MPAPPDGEMEIERNLLEWLFERFLRLRGRTFTGVKDGEWEQPHVDPDWTDQELAEHVARIISVPD